MSSTHTHTHPQGLAHQFDDLAQQHEASTLGMWAFLITEIMFFGGMFMVYILMRTNYPEVMEDANRHLDWQLGGLNTFALLCSSLTMALAVKAAQEGRSKAIVNWLIVTMILGAVFLVVKGFEYNAKWEHHLVPGLNFHYDVPGLAPVAEAFFFLYFAMTGVHAVHMIIGIALVGWIAYQASKGRYTAQYNNPVEMIGLYWHFVDIIWIFLYPLLYLIHPAHGGH